MHRSSVWAVQGFTRWYVGDIDSPARRRRWSPPRRADGSARRLIAVAGHDPLRDDGMRYAELLPRRACRSNCTTPRPGPGFLAYPGVVPAATEAAERGFISLRKAIHQA